MEAWQLLRRKELVQAVEWERLNSVSSFYTGEGASEAPALTQSCPTLYTSISGTIVVTGYACSLDAFVAGGLPHCYTRAAGADNSIRAVDLSPAALGIALSLHQ